MVLIHSSVTRETKDEEGYDEKEYNPAELQHQEHGPCENRNNED
jgi:hypothetical protein